MFNFQHLTIKPDNGGQLDKFDPLGGFNGGFSFVKIKNIQI